MARTATTEAPSGASNVVRLPTAAPRKVAQKFNRSAREARQKLREAQPWPGNYVSPYVREAERVVSRVTSVTMSPELIILTAILSSMDTLAHAKVGAIVAEQVLQPSISSMALVALDIVRLSKPLPYAEAAAIKRAFTDTQGDA